MRMSRNLHLLWVQRPMLQPGQTRRRRTQLEQKERLQIRKRRMIAVRKTSRIDRMLAKR